MRLRNLLASLALVSASCSDVPIEDVETEIALPSAQAIDSAVSSSKEAGEASDSLPGALPGDVTMSLGAANFDLDPALAAELKPLDELDRDELDEDVISFSALSLVGTDIEALLDHIFPINDDPPPPYDYPEEVLALDDTEVKLVGYMIPLTWKEGAVTELMLVRDLASCCFGGIPRPDEWAFVSFPEGESTEYFPYVPVLVTGPLKLYPLEKEASGDAEPSENEGKTAKSQDDELDIEAVFSIRATNIQRY